MTATTREDRWTTLRWAQVNKKTKRHLWLGDATACGMVWTGDVHSLAIAYPDPACKVCFAYAQGWLDRHDTGPRPAFGSPDPTVSAVQMEKRP